MQAAAWLARNGYPNVHNLAGGVEAWALDVDPTMPRY
jgi:rhodanese-related sulfurtransferase